MAQVKVLKIGSDGLATEHATTDEITMTSFSTTGGGPVLSATGLDGNGQNVSDIGGVSFTDPATDGITATAGLIVADDLMATDRNNVMDATSAVVFGVVTDTAGQLDSFKIPHVAGVPTATPAYSADAGYIVINSVTGDVYIWDGSAWDNQSTVTDAENLVSPGYVAGTGGVSIRDVVYISGADEVKPAKGDAVSTARAIGFSRNTALAEAAVDVQTGGILAGFSGLTPQAPQYLSAATAGAITETLPTGTGNVLVRAGYAKSATAVQIQIQQLGVRA